jgi:hypothetical protein
MHEKRENEDFEIGMATVDTAHARSLHISFRDEKRSSFGFFYGGRLNGLEAEGEAIQVTSRGRVNGHLGCQI